MTDRKDDRIGPLKELLKKHRKYVWAATAVSVYAVLGFFMAPWLLHKNLSTAVHDNLGGELRLDRVEVNPFVLSLRIHGLELDDPAGEPTIRADFQSFDPNTITQRYDLTCAFQVLEHFPYHEFTKHIGTLRELSRNYVFISLPYSCRGFTIKLNVQNGQRERLTKQLDFYVRTNLPNRKYREEYKKEFPWAVHFWEIGRKGFKLGKVLNDIKSCGLNIQQRFHSPNSFHYFILCKK